MYARLYDIPYRTVPLDASFGVPVDALIPPSGGVVLANPNAPTGRTVSLDEIESILKADPDRVVLVDEAYADFGTDSCLDLLDRYDNLLLVTTFSKSRALAGVRLGFAMGSRELIEGLERIRDSFNSYPVDRLAEEIGVAAIGDGAWFEETRRKIRGNPYGNGAPPVRNGLFGPAVIVQLPVRRTAGRTRPDALHGPQGTGYTGKVF